MINDALHFRLQHDDLTRYNAVQRLLYVGIILVGILQVLSGLAIWKPVQFSELAALFYDFQGGRLVHFLVHGGDRDVPGRACRPRAAGSAHHRQHGHRRAGAWTQDALNAAAPALAATESPR